MRTQIERGRTLVGLLALLLALLLVLLLTCLAFALPDGTGATWATSS